MKKLIKNKKFNFCVIVLLTIIVLYFSLKDNFFETINQIKNLSSEMENALQPNLALNGLNLNETSSSNINTQNNFNSLVEAFKMALSDMKIELDDEEMGRLVDKTVADAIYS